MGGGGEGVRANPLWSRHCCCLFQFNRNSGLGDQDTDLWIAYCAFHLADYRRAMEVSFFYISFKIGPDK